MKYSPSLGRAVTLGPDGAIYVTNKGDRAGGGEILRIEKAEAVPEPSSFLGILAFGALGIVSFRRKWKQLF